MLFQDAYPKGVIPLAAIQMARPAKDNKFEVVTNPRVFVFRTEGEGEGPGVLMGGTGHVTHSASC